MMLANSTNPKREGKTKKKEKNKNKNETKKEEEILEKQHTTLLEHDLLRTKWGLESFPR